MKKLERPSKKTKTGKPEFVTPKRTPSSFAGTFKKGGKMEYKGGGKVRNMFTQQYD